MILSIDPSLTPSFDEASKIFLKIGDFQIAWYAVIILGGAIICSVIAYYMYLKHLGLDFDTLSEGLALGLLFGILGARLYYVAFSGQHYNNILEVIDPSNGGLAIHGAIIAVSIYVPIFCKIKHLNILTLLEILFPVFMMCQAIGRWGNFMNQEAYGPLIKYPGFISYNNVLTEANLIAQREFLSNLLIPDFIIDRMYIADPVGGTAAGY
jgi:phosphatidylglycerol:prolipoprotein diacylglycerol transferase